MGRERETPTGPAPTGYVRPRADDVDTATGPTEAAAIIAQSGHKPPG